MRMGASRQEGFLGDDHVVPNVNVVLVMKPDTFTDPRISTDVQLPWKSHSGSRPENYSSLNLRTE